MKLFIENVVLVFIMVSIVSIIVNLWFYKPNKPTHRKNKTFGKDLFEDVDTTGVDIYKR
jgi:hypothetical protein